jgi:hypothetical protein
MNAFRDFMKALVTEMRQQPLAGPDLERFDECIPRADPASSALLIRTITWIEVYLVKYPPHHDVNPEVPCQPSCIQCKQSYEQPSAWLPGNTNMNAPEYRPRLWTSRAPGPDGVLAEVLRWTGPKDRSQRLPYRKAICEHLATIFNQILETGKAPSAPQFTDGNLSMLFKAGDRTNPDHYRGICVSSVLGKLFGLVIGAKLGCRTGRK